MNAERPDSTDREIFEQRLEERKERSLPALLAGRLRIDEILKTELEAPGSDQRGGVTLIVRPPAEVIERASRIQSRLQAVEPSQYYCPAGDLHLTLVEICHGRTLSEARLLAQRVSAAIGDVLAEASRFWLDRPRLGFDDGGAALSFLPVGAALQSTRRSIIERLGKLGVDVQSRYPAQSAHVTLMRYTNRLRSRPANWVRCLQSLSPGPPLRWCAARVELTHGAIWYGMRSRVSVWDRFHCLDASRSRGMRAVNHGGADRDWTPRDVGLRGSSERSEGGGAVAAEWRAAGLPGRGKARCRQAAGAREGSDRNPHSGAAWR